MSRIPSVLSPEAERAQRRLFTERRTERTLAALDPFSRQRVREAQQAADGRRARARRRTQQAA